MKYLKSVFFLLVVCFPVTFPVFEFNAQVIPHISNGKSIYSWQEDMKTAYFYVRFQGKVPYIIINHFPQVSNLQKALRTGVITLNNKILNPPNLFPNYYRSNPVSEINGSPEIYLAEIGFAPGDKLISQNVLPDGTGKKIMITTKKYWFYDDSNSPFIIIECEEFSENQTAEEWSIARSITSAKSGTVPKTLDIAIPEKITNKMDELMKNFIPEEYWKPDGEVRKILGKQFWISTSPIRVTDKIGSELMYYTGIVSYGVRGYYGQLYLFDSEGNVLDTKEHLGGSSYIGFEGLTDLDADGTHELIVRCTGYAGGIELLEIIYNEDGQLKLETKLKFNFFES
ncbi:hypothetical protein ACFL7D_06230 [candidate division KSB1 bacterium]